MRATPSTSAAYLILYSCPYIAFKRSESCVCYPGSNRGEANIKGKWEVGSGISELRAQSSEQSGGFINLRKCENENSENEKIFNPPTEACTASHASGLAIVWHVHVHLALMNPGCLRWWILIALHHSLC